MKFQDGFLRKGDAECWLWFRGKTAAGYGTFVMSGQHRYAHRYSYELHIGPVPEGAHVLHRCDNPACVNPAHLFLGDQRSNLVDMRAKGRGYDIGARNGSTNGMAKLDEDAVRDIRAIYDGARGAQSEIARWYGVRPQTIRAIVMGRTWRHVPLGNASVHNEEMPKLQCACCGKRYKYSPYLKRHQAKCQPVP